MKKLINEAADMMAAFDRNAAKIFRNQPFHRGTIATAFRKGFRTHTAQSLATCDLLDRVAALDVKYRELAA
jgi:alkylhydroperoxidase/carboxymuconolactone decarboxylase family protein YurZ